MKPPKITIIQLDPRTEFRAHRNRRCEHETTSTGTPWYSNDQRTCSHFARFKFGKHYYCAIHAGQAALRFRLKQQEKS